MRTEWKQVKIGEVCEVFDGPHATPNRTDDGPIFLGISSLDSGRIDLSQSDHVSEEDFAQWTKRVTPESGDVVFSYETRLGEAGLIPPGLRCCLGRRMGLLRVKDRSFLDPSFLLYNYLGPAFQAVISERTVFGSTVERIPLKEVPDFPITIPPISEQKAIAHILGTLDDKIELNRKTNETLEDIAKALFKSWFVDFDPVRAKSEGRPTGMPDEISDLFPDSFEDSELGEIPSGWRVDSIYAVASVVYGAPFSSSLFNGDGSGIPVARIRDLPGESPGVYTTEVHPKGTLILPGDIVVGMDGEFRAYLWGGEECWMNQRVCKFIPSEKSRTCFLRESIRKPLWDVEMSETATTVIHLGKGDIDGFRILLPSLGVLDRFSEATSPLYAEIVANKQQARVLSSLRDALLPKLISGEIRIPDAEKMLEEVGI